MPDNHEGPPAPPSTQDGSLFRRSSGSATGMPVPGDVVAGKYEIGHILGEGGMGIVVAAKQMPLGHQVAIKFMRAEAAASPHAVGRFLREARAVVGLSSEHVAKVFDFGTLPTGEPYMVMEYLSGADLRALVEKGGPLPIPEAIELVLQACEAIAEAHSQGIVHRDLKPANLFVTRRRDGTPLVKVLDFGISKASVVSTAGSENLTSSGIVMGSPGYMSPEQVKSAKTVDARSDVWALGVILYELLSGVSPFQGENVGETFARILTEVPSPIGRLRSDMPEGLGELVAQCLERDVERRIPSVSALATRLLPFAPPAARLSVDRISYVDGGSARTTLAAEAPPFRSPNAPETGPAWLKSVVATRPSTKRWPRAAAAVVFTLMALLAGAELYAVTRHHRAAEPAAPTAAEHALEPVPAPLVSAVVPATASPRTVPSSGDTTATPAEALDASVPSTAKAGKVRPASLVSRPAPAGARTTGLQAPSASPAPEVAPAVTRPESPATRPEPLPTATDVFEHRE